jgi:hypothetical protein
MAKGQSFLRESATSKGPILHLNVIITEPDEEMCYLVVPITTYREDQNARPYSGQDESCILKSGCHPFIKHKSYVRYEFARKMSTLEIASGLLKGLLIRKEDMDQVVIQDMQRGAEESRYLDKKLRHFFNFFL